MSEDAEPQTDKERQAETESADDPVVAALRAASRAVAARGSKQQVEEEEDPPLVDEAFDLGDMTNPGGDVAMREVSQRQQSAEPERSSRVSVLLAALRGDADADDGAGPLKALQTQPGAHTSLEEDVDSAMNSITSDLIDASVLDEDDDADAKSAEEPDVAKAAAPALAFGVPSVAGRTDDTVPDTDSLGLEPTIEPEDRDTDITPGSQPSVKSEDTVADDVEHAAASDDDIDDSSPDIEVDIDVDADDESVPSVEHDKTEKMAALSDSSIAELSDDSIAEASDPSAEASVASASVPTIPSDEMPDVLEDEPLRLETADHEALGPDDIQAVAAPPPPPPTPANVDVSVSQSGVITSAGATEKASRRRTTVPIPATDEPQTMRIARRRAWFDQIFDDDYARLMPWATPEVTRMEADFIQEVLQPSADSHVLDVGCGVGRHAIELARRGLKVTGVDLSLPLVIRAADNAQEQGVDVTFVHSDCRELNVKEVYDASYCVSSTFGMFDDDANRLMIRSIATALKPRGRLLLEVVNRDYALRDLPTRVWWDGDGCFVLEEVSFDFYTSRIDNKRSVVFQDGRHLEQEISMRSYSLHELGKLLHHAGFRVLEVSGHYAHRNRFFGRESRSLILLAEKRGRPTNGG